MRVTRQIHIWISEADDAYLRQTAAIRQTSLGAVIRRLISAARHTTSRTETRRVPTNAETVDRQSR